MSIKDVRDYHLKMTSDYMELKTTLDTLQSEIDEESSAEALKNISELKALANKVQENYNRINYIIYLLDKPTRKNKHTKWENQNKKRLNDIPNKDRLDAISKENKQSLDGLKKYVPC